MSTINQATLRIFFKGIFFIVDGVIDAYLDGKRVGKGSSTKGMDITMDIEPGRHTLTLHLLGGLRSRSYYLDINPVTICEVNLKYSRIWGNFTRKPDIKINNIKT